MNHDHGAGQGAPAESIVLGGGCFWCIEAVFNELRGVLTAESGYAGGTTASPTYEQVCSGKTGHAEVVRVTFDPSQVTLHELLEVFFAVHDPTTPDRQGHDVGTQYRSTIFSQDERQRAQIDAFLEELTREPLWANPIVTKVEPLPVFYRAEEDHQEYFRRNPQQSYCSVVIAPKVATFRQTFQRLRKAVPEP
jgi:peptide-methionine (S)-S-oxide reductase